MHGYEDTHQARPADLPTAHFAAPLGAPPPAPPGAPPFPAGPAHPPVGPYGPPPAGAGGSTARRVLLGVAAVAMVGAASIGTGWYLGRPDPAPTTPAAVPSSLVASSAVPGGGAPAGGTPGAAPAASLPAAPPAASPARSAAPLVTGPILPGGAVAGCTMGPGQDGSGNTVFYDAINLIDENPETAWRCPGHGQESVTFRLNPQGTVTVTEVALIPGYAKTDPVGKVDRFAQNYTVTRVRWSFTGGSSPQTYEQTIARPGRQPARFTLPAPVEAATLTMTVLDTAEPTASPGSNVGIAVSEVSVIGVR